MGITLKKTPSAIAYKLQNKSVKAALRIKDESAKIAEDIKDLAAIYTPYKTGALQESIRVDSERTFTGVEHTITTDVVYAERREVETYNYGPGTQAKIASGIPAGNFYMARAMQIFRPEAKKRIVDIIKGFFR